MGLTIMSPQTGWNRVQEFFGHENIDAVRTWNEELWVSQQILPTLAASLAGAQVALNLERADKGDDLDDAADDIEELEKLGHKICELSLCGLGQAAPNPILSMLDNFRPEFEAHVVDKKCPGGVCKALINLHVLDNHFPKLWFFNSRVR